MTDKHTPHHLVAPCECVSCCDGEHAGFCMECAGWGSNNEESICSHCEGTGTCPVCNGDEYPHQAVA